MVVATLCYVKKNCKTLMIHRIKKQNDTHKGKWNGLGGKCEFGETPEECVVREVKEESGLSITNPLLKGVITFPEFDRLGDWYVFVFVALEFEGSVIDSPEGNLQWISDEQLLALNLWEGDRYFIPLLGGEHFFSAKFIYKDGALLDYNIILY